MYYPNRARLDRLPEPKNVVNTLQKIPQADELLEAVRLLKEHLCFTHIFVSDACEAVERLVAEPTQNNLNRIEKLKTTIPSTHKSQTFISAIAICLLLCQASESFYFRKDPQFLNKFKKYLEIKE